MKHTIYKCLALGFSCVLLLAPLTGCGAADSKSAEKSYTLLDVAEPGKYNNVLDNRTDYLDPPTNSELAFNTYGVNLHTITKTVTVRLYDIGAINADNLTVAAGNDISTQDVTVATAADLTAGNDVTVNGNRCTAVPTIDAPDLCFSEQAAVMALTTPFGAPTGHPLFDAWTPLCPLSIPHCDNV